MSLEALEAYGKAFLEGRKDLGDVDVAGQWKLLLTKEEIQKAVTKCAAAIDDKFVGQDVVVVCILKGCAYFLVDLTRSLTIPYSTYFVEASSYHNAQTQADSVELLSILVPSKFKGKKVILLDELYDNGATLSNVRQKLVTELSLNEADIFTCTLLRKCHEVNKYPLPDLVGLVIPTVWVVGYGLDDQQEKRGWEDLWACPKAAGVPPHVDDKLFVDTEFYQAQRTKMLSQIE